MNLRIRPVEPQGDDALLQVIALADRNKATLGPMPRGAFGEFAAQRTLFAAVTDEGTVSGYALFALALGRIRLIHLCVAENFRRVGIAALLIEEISRANPGARGIRLRCRADYAAQTLWPKLGFAAVNEVRGRGKDGTLLVVWWRTHNLPDLFTQDYDEALTVAIDHNVFIDLAVSPEREGAAESHGLEADWLQGQIRLVVTPETYNEILRLKSRTERDRQRAALTAFPLLESSPGAHARAAEKLRLRLGEVETDEVSDFNHVVCAAAGGATIFVTRDSRWIARVAKPAADVLDVRVLRPSDIVAHLDELQHAENYRPVSLHGTGFTVVDSAAGSEAALDGLIALPSGEKRTRYRALLREVAGDPELLRQQVRDPAGQVVVAWAAKPDVRAAQVIVPFLRASSASLAPTVLRLVLFQLKSLALAHRATRVVVTDAHRSGAVAAALTEDGFLPGPVAWTAWVLDVSDTRAALSRLPADDARRDELARASLVSSPAAVSAFERALWPVKLLDTDLPSYLVPIRPHWARELFSLQDPLWERAPLLGISREHVYYRSRRQNPTAPARILWYASGSGRNRIGAVVATSHLVEVVTDTPARLHRRFQHLGVYRRTHVEATAAGGFAAALRFVDTEVLLRPVTYERLRALAGSRRMGSLQSPTMISSGLFGSVYREGSGRDER